MDSRGLITEANRKWWAVDKAGVASGTLQMFRMVGGTIGVAATASLL